MLSAADRRHSFNAGRFPGIGPHNNFSFEPYKFDPICIDDPLEIGNNVGRNCFRILQVQRCLSEVVNAVDQVLKAADDSFAPRTSSIFNETSSPSEIMQTAPPACSLKLILGEEYEKALIS